MEVIPKVNPVVKNRFGTLDQVLSNAVTCFNSTSGGTTFGFQPSGNRSDVGEHSLTPDFPFLEEGVRVSNILFEQQLTKHEWNGKA